jgi:hypothetical protein
MSDIGVDGKETCLMVKINFCVKIVRVSITGRLPVGLLQGSA